MLSASRLIRTSLTVAPERVEAAGRVEPDPGEPRPERAVVAQAVEREHRGEDGLLCGLGGEILARRGAAGGRAEERGVAVDELREGGAVTPAGGADEGGVVGRHLTG